MEDSVSRYMNPPECPVEVGKKYFLVDALLDSTVYTVESIIIKENKYYANCSYRNEFDGILCSKEIYAFYLKEV